MDAAYYTIFSNPVRTANGVAGSDLDGIDVEAVLATYISHRQSLVDLGVLKHLTAHSQHLVFDGSVQHTNARSIFEDRIWAEFPGHKHYFLAPDGKFETWAPLNEESQWQQFLEDENRRTD